MDAGPPPRGLASPSGEWLGSDGFRGLGPLPVVDEAYLGMQHADGIRVLMETDHPLNDRPVVYLGPRPSRRAINIQLGHSARTMRYPGYRNLLRNAILQSVGRLQ